MTLEDLPDPPWDYAALFPGPAPVELEIGCGRGLFLVNAGQSFPQVNFLGVEYDYKEARRAARRLQKRSLSNVRIVGADANVVLADYIPAGSLQALHVYFPDPWWKRRHRKRRIWNSGFVDAAARVLRGGGLLHAWTDVAEYFEVILSLLEGHPAFRVLPPPSERPAEHDMDYHTSFERKKRKLGLPIYRARWERLPASDAM
ncbi:MAG: tRNA (guanosine(46)-N7)-methyltransferase TrmB [Planctomycetales bacterium]